MLCYPVNLLKDADTGAVVVEFPDIPFAHSVGDDEGEALLNAADALATAFEVFEERREPIPSPSVPSKAQPVVVLPVVMAGKVALYNALLSTDKRKADLARMLNLAPTLVDRLLSLRHKSRIEQIETALAVLGKKLVVDVREAA